MKQLEELHLIKVVENEVLSTQKLLDQFRGNLSNDTADAIKKDVSDSRKEWDRI